MAKMPLKKNVIRLGHFHPDTQILVEKGGDRVVVSPEEMVEACLTRDQMKELIARKDLFERQMRLLVDRLNVWVEQHKDRMADAFFQAQPDCQMFLVVLREVEHDPEIEKDLTALTIEIANDPAFSMARLDVQAMPNCPPEDVRSFIDLAP